MEEMALATKTVHRAIHKDTYQKADDLTNVLREMWEMGDSQVHMLQKAYELVGHWEEQTLIHAAEEERGLYVTAVKDNPALKEKVLQLVSEHQLLRVLVGQIKGILENIGMNEHVLSRFDTLLLVNEIHNYREEINLLGRNHY